MPSRCTPAVGLLLITLASPFVANGAGPIAYLAFSDDGYWQAWSMNPDGSAQTQITRSPYDKARLSWYPDSQHLLINGNQGELMQVDAHTGAEQPIPMALGGMSDAVLSPDGRLIAFSLSTSGSIDDNNIWLVNTDGSGLRKLVARQYLQHEPAWAPDSGAVYFLSGQGGQDHDIWRYRLADGSLEQLTVGRLYHFDLAPGPNGTLAYSANRTGNYEIWLWSEGGEPRALTGDPALDGRPSWSPDGSELIFESTRGGVPDIWKVSAQGGDPVRLTATSQGARLPVWRQGENR